MKSEKRKMKITIIILTLCMAIFATASMCPTQNDVAPNTAIETKSFDKKLKINISGYYIAWSKVNYEYTIKKIENDDRVNYAMGEESNNNELGLIGWANTGLVAYLKYEWGYMWINGIRLIIYDAVKNSVTEDILKGISHDIDDYEPILPPEEEIRTTLKTWNDTLAKHNFSEGINKFNIRFDTVKPSPFPYVQGSSSWDCHFEAVVEEPIDEQPWNEPAIVKWNLLASNGPQTKIVASGAEESKGGSGMGGAYAGSNVIGYYKSPFEDRLLVAIAHYTAEFEGEIHRWVHLYGFHLSF
jgi:predicted small secreted protein